jgi:signal transduction histidine kinase
MKLRPIAFAPLHRAAVRHSGAGLGVLICRSIIEAHDGQVWAEPNWPRQATFHFTLQSHREDAL